MFLDYIKTLQSNLLDFKPICEKISTRSTSVPFETLLAVFRDSKTVRIPFTVRTHSTSPTFRRSNSEPGNLNSFAVHSQLSVMCPMNSEPFISLPISLLVLVLFLFPFFIFSFLFFSSLFSSSCPSGFNIAR